MFVVEERNNRGVFWITKCHLSEAIYVGEICPIVVLLFKTATVSNSTRSGFTLAANIIVILLHRLRHLNEEYTDGK